MNSEQYLIDYQRIEKAIEFIRAHREDQPSLDDIASHIHLSPHHFQRLFTKWAGISPKKFLQYLTINYARECLAKNESLAEVSYHAGLTGPGRLHDLFINLEGMTPDQYRKAGAGQSIYYGFHHCPFGKYLIAITGEYRICTLQFISEEKQATGELRKQWAASELKHDQEKTAEVASGLFTPAFTGKLDLLVRGTSFQIKVWEALLKIPFGEIVSYQTIAEHLENPGGLQAVGSAIGKNPVAYLIPCHRVIRKAGQISEYRWGSTRKSAILGWEAAQYRSANQI